MVDPQPGPERTLAEAPLRWWPGPSVAARSYAIRMALALVVATLLTACLVGLALLLDSRATRWEGPVVFGVTLFIVLFYGWAIYSTVHGVPAVGSGVPAGPLDDSEPGGTASE